MEKGKQSTASTPSATFTTFPSLRVKAKKSQYDKELQSIEKDRLNHQLKKDLRGNAKQFWETLKTAILQHYETTDGAFLAFSNPADGMMSFEQFEELCTAMGFQLNWANVKGLFELKLRDWELYAFTLQDFQDACIVAQLERMRQRVRAHRQNLLACAGHIDGFIRHLCLYTGEDRRRRAVLRFQQKLTTEFCIQLWEAMKQRAERKGQDTEPLIGSETFLKMTDGILSLQAYETDFLANIFERVDRARKGEVVMSDLAVTMLLMTTCSSRCDKAKLIFMIFDTDNDGCLSSEQLLKMYCSLTIHAAIARGDQPSYDADILLGDELSLAKARRIYDYTVSHPSDALDDDLCTFEELWCIIGTNLNMLEELMPGTYGITWVLRSRGGVSRRPEAKVEKKMSSKRRPPEWNLRSSTLVVGPERTGRTEDAESAQSSKRKETKGARPMGRKAEGAERFRVHAAIRFRHAVRGEWDAIAALQSGPPNTAEQLLPSLEERSKRSALWAEEVGSFGRRQRRGHWHDNHRDTLTDWSRTLAPIEEKPSSLSRNARSLPELRHERSTEDEFFSAPLNFEELRSITEAKVSDTRNQDRSVLQRLKIDTQRFGQTAIARFRSAAMVRSAVEHHEDLSQTSNDTGQQWCEVCRCRHSSACLV